MPKCCEDKFGKVELVFNAGEDNAFEEFLNFRDEVLTDEETLLKHFENLSRLESCDPLAPVYRIGLNPISSYNFGGRAYA